MRFFLLISIAAVCSNEVLYAGDKDRFQEALEQMVRSTGLKVSPAFSKELEDGNLEMRSRNYLRAAHHFGEAYRKSKEHPLPPFLIGIACVGMEQYDKASEFLRHAMRLWPEFPKAKPDLTAWLMDGKEYDRLAFDLEKELYSRKRGTPEASRALFLLGFFRAFGGDAKAAAKQLAAVPESAPERAAARLVLLSLRPARSALPKGKTDDPFKWGNDLFIRGSYAEAAHAFGAAVVRNPKDSLAYFEMGHALFAAGYFRHAARVLSLGIELCPGWGGVDMDRASFYPTERRNDYGEQIERLKKWTASHPRDGASLFLLGYNLYFSKDPESSRPAFGAAAREGWGAQSAYFLTWLEKKSRGEGGKPPDMPPPPETGPSLEPPDPPDPIREGREKLQKGDFDGAVQAFIRTVSDPNRGAEGMMGLAASWLGKGDFQNAALWVRNGLRKNWDAANRAPWAEAFGDPAVFDARLASLAGKTKAIHKERLKGLKPGAEDREIWFLYGYCLYRKGKSEAAAEQFKQIILEVATADAEAVRLYELIKK